MTYRGVARLLAALTLVVATLLTTAGDWPMYLHDAQRSAAGGGETTLSPANAGGLVKLWSFKTSGVVATSASVVNNIVYAGSWDGYEYALDAATGALLWKTYIGVTTADPACSPSSAGVSSAAAVQNGVVYVGGGDAYWYALDAATGAILWKVYTGDNSAAGGHYNWASPLLYNGYAYIGVASMGDCPLVQGQLLQVSLTTHQIVHTFNAVPAGQVGGGVWTSPSVDAATSTIYVTTGTEGQEPITTQPQTLALVALDAATLAVKGSWQIPPASAVLDSDWGNTPILFSDATGASLVAAVNKNGYLYTFDQGSISSGPLWQRQIATGGSCPQCGAGNVSSGAFDGSRLYMAGGVTSIGGVSYKGAVRALDPATGNYLWEHGTTGVVIAALAYADGLVFDGAGAALEILNAATGATLYSYKTGATIYGAPSVSNGRVFVGSVDGNVYAFGLPSAGTNAGTGTGTGTNTGTGAGAPTPTPAPAGTGLPIDLSAYVTNRGISDDSAPAAADFDGYGYSYSAQALQAAGLVAGQTATYNGITFRWPNAASGAADDVVAQGQRIVLPASATGATLAFLGAASSGPSTGTGTITYADGSTQSFALGLSDWTFNGGSAGPPAYGNSIVASMSYRNAGYGSEALQTGVFYTGVALRAGKAVVSVTLPATASQGALHLFAMSLAGGAAVASATNTPVPVASATNTPVPVASATNTPVPVASATNTPVPVASATNTPVPVAPPAAGQVDLSASYNNKGISSDTSPGAANFDGYGYSLSAQALQAVGLVPGQAVTYNGVTFQWPNTQPGSADNVAAQGQRMTLASPVAGVTLAFLGAASSGPSTGTGTITYADGSTQSFALGLSDWTLNGGGLTAGYGNGVVASLPYRNGGGGRQALKTYVFYTGVALRAGKAVVSVTLPATASQGALHLFALTVS